MKRPVDIVVGTYSRFRKFGESEDSLMIEGEVKRNGILLYDAAGEANWDMDDHNERIIEWKEWLRFAQMDYDCALYLIPLLIPTAEAFEFAS